jgi:hypothetical protein
VGPFNQIENIVVSKMRTLSGRIGSNPKATLNQERQKALGITHGVIMVLLDLPKLGNTGKLNIR